MWLPVSSRGRGDDARPSVSICRLPLPISPSVSTRVLTDGEDDLKPSLSWLAARPGSVVLER